MIKRNAGHQWHAPPLAVATSLRLLCGIGVAGAVHAQSVDDPAALNAEVLRLYQAGKYAEATEIARHVLVLVERRPGPEHPGVV